MMYATQFVTGTAILTVALQLVGGMFLPSPPPIRVDSLEYIGGAVVQSRYVSGDDKVSAVWSARVIDAVSGQTVPGCEGAGGWDYSPGPKEAIIPLAEWVGSNRCALPSGHYQLFAQYKVGTWSTDARSPIFEVAE